MGPSNYQGGLSGQAMNPSTSSGGEEQQIEKMVKQAISGGKTEKDAIDSVVQALGMIDSLVVFFGFQGTLANSFTYIDNKEQEEIKMRLFAIDDSVSPVFMSIAEFYAFYSKYNVPDGTINPIKIEDAFSTLRFGEKKKEEKFEDVEVDEFDDNCNEDCLPGGHTCSKRNG